MTFDHVWVLHFLWLMPLAALALVAYSRKRKKAMERFADAELLVRLTGIDQHRRRVFRGLLLVGALGLMLFALAGPRWGSHYQEVSQKGVDVMILADVSSSMEVADVKPSRLERAKREILDFLQVVQGDRVGLVAFAGAAFIQCPLTLDYGALQMFLNALEPGLIPIPGTDLGAAIETGLSGFDPNSETDKVMILITDGEDNEKKGLEAAEKAASKGVRIFVFGMGETSGGPIPLSERQGGFKKDSEGKLILSKLDEESLKKIAATAGGVYVRSVSGDLDLDILYFDGIKSRTEAQTLKSGKIKVYEERFTLFTLAAFLFLLLEGLIVTSRGKTTKVFKNTQLAVLFFGLIFAGHALAAETPDDLYRQGRFAEAEKAYALSDMEHPKDVRYRYNRGCAAYEGGDFKGAVAAFSSVYRRAKDDDMRFRASYNLGNTAFKLGDFGSAATYYKQALRLNPTSEDARHNLELALRELEKQKEKKDQESQKGAGTESKETPEQSGEKKDGSHPEQKGENHDKENREKSSEQASKQAKGQKDENRQNPSEQAGKTEQKKESPQDLSGELTAKQQLPEGEDKESASEQATAMIDKKRGAALLDNIKEDPSRFFQFLLPKEKRQGVESGKDW